MISVPVLVTLTSAGIGRLRLVTLSPKLSDEVELVLLAAARSLALASRVSLTVTGFSLSPSLVLSCDVLFCSELATVCSWSATSLETAVTEIALVLSAWTVGSAVTSWLEALVLVLWPPPSDSLASSSTLVAGWPLGSSAWSALAVLTPKTADESKTEATPTVNLRMEKRCLESPNRLFMILSSHFYKS